ncbi:unnamed protein product [Rotaria sp. Silwood2]|nr:unnamed protein product [Rotaria sp. Silwood2]CAF3221431.1 unnamed protein product [Rotaria sp. Silwood2]CAF4172492.1 unnamed protein product [Rotaria sp. Silwood2]CAF4365309.1 unnamed protein product [Rotaria sp. Silwood2]
MIQIPSPDAHELLKVSKFLTPNDDDQELEQALFIFHKHVNKDSDSEPELNAYSDNECYDIVDKNNITFGRTNRGGRELYMCGYTYQVKEKNATATRWRCVIRTPTCPVTIHTNNIDDSFIYWNGAYHHHPPNRSRELIKNIISKIKARVLVEPYPVVSIAEEEIRNAKLDKSQLAAMPLPSQMESALQKHRRKNIPCLPLSLDFEIPLLYQHTWSGGKFLIADIQRKRVGGRLIMFSSNEQIDLLLNSSTWFCDGTFKTRPIMFSQVYIIQCLVGDEVFPAIYALTSNRKRKTYEEMIKVILHLAADRNKLLPVETIVSDYEEAWLLTVEEMLPNVVRLGCFFHFTQSCYRNIQRLGLSKLYEDEPDVRLALRKFLGLALLPRNQVKKCFKLLCKNSDGRIQSFIEYFKQQWMIDMGSDLWCVADSAIRTNNSCEDLTVFPLSIASHLFINNNLISSSLLLKNMIRSRFKFTDLGDFDGLVRKCLNIIPQYSQVYPAARADVSISLEEMISKGFPSNQNIVWHKGTHSQKRYYWIMKPNRDDEVRVKVSSGGTFSKADRDLRILTSTNECRKIIHQFLVRWDKTGLLPGWKTIWTVFNIANYDISERRIKTIHKVIRDHVIREVLDGDEPSGSDIENKIQVIFEPPIIPTKNLPTSQRVQPDTTGYINSSDFYKENHVVYQAANICQTQQQPSNITTTLESSSSVMLCNASPSKSLTTAAQKRTRKRRVYEQKSSPYVIRKRAAIADKLTK